MKQLRQVHCHLISPGTTNIRHVSLFLVCAQRESTKDWWPLGLNVGSPRFSVSAGSICDRLRQSRASVCEEWFVLDRTRPHKPKALTRPHSLDLHVFLAVARTPLYALSNSPRAHTRVYACPDFQQKTCTLFLSRFTYPRSPACMPNFRPSSTLLSASF